MEITSLNSLSHYVQRLVEANLWVKVVFALMLGVGTGVLISPAIGIFGETTSQSIGSWLALPGKLFLKLVQMVMIPLVFTSIISGIASNNVEGIKKMGLKLLLYFLTTTAISITIGVFLAITFKPGSYLFNSETSQSELPVTSEKTSPFKDLPTSISELLPDNPISAMVTGEMLSIVIFTVIIGLAIIQLKETTIKPILSLFHAVQEICMTVVSWAMRLVPYAVFGLIAQLVSTIGINSLAGIGFYFAVVLLGLLVLLLFYMSLILLIAKKNPFKFLGQIKDVMLLAFSTTSSAAVMPLSMKTADEKLGVSSKVSDFIIPIGATINMDGTAIFQCISTLFIAQTYGMEMTLINIVLIMVTIVAASIGTPAIPGGGVVILASVLQGAGIPAEGLVIIVGIERILGMFRTAINVTGDLTACVVFNEWSSESESITS